MAINFFKKSKKGFGIIEMLIVVFLVVVGLNSLLGFSSFSLSTSNLAKQTTQANKLALEGIEAARNFRDGTDWDVDGLGILTNGTIYHPQKSSDNPPKWQFVAGEETVSNFKRKIVFGGVFRDSNTDDIASSGYDDPKTKKVTVTVTWKNETVELVTYLTDWR